jgi:hypothetical protein
MKIFCLGQVMKFGAYKRIWAKYENKKYINHKIIFRLKKKTKNQKNINHKYEGNSSDQPLT